MSPILFSSIREQILPLLPHLTQLHSYESLHFSFVVLSKSAKYFILLRCSLLKKLPSMVERAQRSVLSLQACFAQVNELPNAFFLVDRRKRTGLFVVYEHIVHFFGFNSMDYGVRAGFFQLNGPQFRLHWFGFVCDLPSQSQEPGRVAKKRKWHSFILPVKMPNLMWCSLWFWEDPGEQCSVDSILSKQYLCFHIPLGFGGIFFAFVRLNS